MTGESAAALLVSLNAVVWIALIVIASVSSSDSRRFFASLLTIGVATTATVLAVWP
jgi:hypothetical protein